MSSPTTRAVFLQTLFRAVVTDGLLVPLPPPSHLLKPNLQWNGTRRGGPWEALIMRVELFLFFFGRPSAHGFPRPGIGSEPQLQAKLRLQQQWILNPLRWSGN